VHYHIKTLVINNLEFDHADIFDSLKDIQKQFHHLFRIVPNDGLIVHPKKILAIDQVIAMGLYSEQQVLPTSKLKISTIGTTFKVENNVVNWNLLGEHNMQNGLHAIYATHHIGMKIKTACEALNTFQGVKRRLEIKHQTADITLYDDFAHHPTAIQTTLSGLRAKVGNENIVAILELRSNTMKSGIHQQSLVNALSEANQVLILKPENQDWGIDFLFSKDNLFNSVEDIVAELTHIKQGHFVVMSNGDFNNIFNKIIAKL
jgi:UDP-N-acetylmuramate: L-alanyl-gamma-D-glutamyl-meso-diaminopimelate ligase